MPTNKPKNEPTREKPLEAEGLIAREETAVPADRMTELIRNSVKVFEELGIDTKEFAPIILSEDTVVDGTHRREAYPDWPSKQIGIMDPTVVKAVRFMLNYFRRRVDTKDMTEGLAAIAEATGARALRIVMLVSEMYLTSEMFTLIFHARLQYIYFGSEPIYFGLVPTSIG